MGQLVLKKEKKLVLLALIKNKKNKKNKNALNYFLNKTLLNNRQIKL